MTRLALQSFSRDQIVDSLDEVKSVFARTYAEPPYYFDDNETKEFVRRMEDLYDSDFSFIAGTVDETIVGFSYGFVFNKGTWWEGAQEQPPQALMNTDKFAVIELVVDKPFQNQGYSRELFTRLLSERSETYATLLARPGNRSHVTYQRWGWHRIGSVQSYPHWPVDDIFAIKLSDPTVEPQAW